MFSCVWVKHEVPIDSQISGHRFSTTPSIRGSKKYWFCTIPTLNMILTRPRSRLYRFYPNIWLFCGSVWRWGKPHHLMHQNLGTFVDISSYHHHMRIICLLHHHCLKSTPFFSRTIHHLNGERWLDLQFPLVHSTFVLQDGFPRKNSWFITPFEYFMICLIAIVTIVIILVINQL